MIITNGVPQIDKLPTPKVELYSLTKYTELAKKYIDFYCCFRKKQLNMKFIKSDDVLAYVIEAIVISDHYFDPNIQRKASKRSTFQIRAVIWMIDKLTNKKNGKKYKFESKFVNANPIKSPRENFWEIEAPTLSADSIIEKEEYLSSVEKSIDLLSERDRNIIDDYYFQDKTLRKIAEEEGVSFQAIQQRLSESILPKIRKELKKRGMNEIV